VAMIALGLKTASKSELLAGIFWLTHNKKEVYGGGKYAGGDAKERGGTTKVIRETITKNYDKRTLEMTRETRMIEPPVLVQDDEENEVNTDDGNGNATRGSGVERLYLENLGEGRPS
jgi:hypothetical protein